MTYNTNLPNSHRIYNWPKNLSLSYVKVRSVVDIRTIQGSITYKMELNHVKLYISKAIVCNMHKLAQMVYIGKLVQECLDDYIDFVKDWPKQSLEALKNPKYTKSLHHKEKISINSHSN